MNNFELKNMKDNERETIKKVANKTLLNIHSYRKILEEILDELVEHIMFLDESEEFVQDECDKIGIGKNEYNVEEGSNGLGITYNIVL